MRLLMLAGLVACNKGGGPDEETDDYVDWSGKDADGDGILDIHEGYVDESSPDANGATSRDSDGDGTPDYMDLDSDDDTLADSVEAGDADLLTLPFDSDADGTPDYLDLDSDSNCIPDETDGAGDQDEDGIGFFADLDDDGDEILDWVEIGDDCGQPDSDADGRADFRDRDSDGDGVGDVWEGQTSAWEETPGDVDVDGEPNYLDWDSDGDGFTDSAEGGVDNPEKEPRDTDGDGIYDFLDIDSDADGLTDAAERDQFGTSPYNDDTDGDGYTDGAEVGAGTDPKDAGDVISGLYVVVPERTSVEEVFEFELNVQMGDVAFLIDTTGSMSGTLNAMATEYSAIVTALSSALPDAEYGVGTYDDYAYSSYGYSSSGDKPFILKTQITSDVSRVQSTLSGLTTHYGGDAPESGMEALYQSLKGDGYDQNCNSSYDSLTDVPPFIAYSGDAFGGSAAGAWSSTSSGGGSIGGYGFRDYALPVVVYATDNNLRDPDGGYGSPGGCPVDGGRNEVIAAATDIGAYLIGIQCNNYTSTLIPQMNDLADNTGSYADTDGDGAADDRLVFSWTGGSTSVLRTTIVNAIQDLVGSVQFDEISLQIENDTYGFVTAIDPEVYTLSSSATGQVVDFTLEFRGAVAAADEDQIFEITLNVLGDGTVLLDSLTIYVLVPGTSYG